MRVDRGLPFGTPGILHSTTPMGTDAWPADGSTFQTKLMLLDKQTVPAPLEFEHKHKAPAAVGIEEKHKAPAAVGIEEKHTDAPAPVAIEDKHWAGGNGAWLVYVQFPCTWTIENVYRSMILPMKSLASADIFRAREPGRRDPHTLVRKKCAMNLLKIQLLARPYKIQGKWHYDAIAVFDKAITFIHSPSDEGWTLLPHAELRPRICTDAIGTYCLWERRMRRIYAVTAPRGDVFVWQPYEYGTDSAPRLILPPAGWQVDAVGDDDDEERCWFLATMPHASSPTENNLMLIHTTGGRNWSSTVVFSMGTHIQSHPNLRCYVFARCAHQKKDPVDAASWRRLASLNGQSVFVGINSPFFLDAPAAAAADDKDPDAANTAAASPALEVIDIYEGVWEDPHVFWANLDDAQGGDLDDLDDVAIGAGYWNEQSDDEVAAAAGDQDEPDGDAASPAHVPPDMPVFRPDYVCYTPARPSL